MSTQTLDLTTSLRLPLQPKPTTTLPTTIDFDFDNLRNTMSAFTSRFDDYIKKSRSALLAERNTHRMSLSHIVDQTTSTESQITGLQKQMEQHSEGVKGQDAEIEGMKREVEEYTIQRDRRREEVESLRGRERDVRRLLMDARGRSKMRKEWFDEQRAADLQELAFWEEVLGVRMEGTGREDVVRFVFCFEEGRRVRREAGFELNMGSGFVVEGCEPALGERWSEVQRLGREMEKNEELGGLLKGMRGLFAERLGF